MTQEVLKRALEALHGFIPYLPLNDEAQCGRYDEAITAIKEALAQPYQEPVAYDKTEMNCFVQDLYDKKMQEGKHGHYETMFHVVHQAIKKVPPQRTWVGLTYEEAKKLRESTDSYWELMRLTEDKLKNKNTGEKE